ncbi:MAG: hypothetical protein KDD47_23085, partial [Acidobacteria bacterium]|nr:hypothetical protein [Acidobacteriota bacterium]
QVTVTQVDGATQLTFERHSYDGLGRLSETYRTMPNGEAAVRKIEYRSTGWKYRETEFQPESALDQWTVYSGYDPFGRVGLITPPDGSDYATTITYNGVGAETRKWKVKGVGGTLQQAQSFKRINALGRIVRLHESDPAGGSDLETYYGYDVGGRLIRVHSGQQQRAFEYDNRGFLLSEKHPEIGDGTVPSLEYGSYDSRGQAGYRLLAPGFDQEYRYDRAGRLTQVLEPGNPLPLKEYFYARTNGFGNPADRRAGKLVGTKRRNLVATLGAEQGATSDIVITESFAYRDAGGAMTDRELRTSDGTVFHEQMTYDSLGNLATLSYPDCLYPAECAAEMPARQLNHGYRNGYLTSIAGYVNNILYRSNGMWSRVVHSNGVWDRQNLYSSAAGTHYLPLPGKIFTSNVQNGPDLDLPNYAYDGARNITQIGGDSFSYDLLNRLARAELSGDGSRDYSYDRYGNLLSINGDPDRPGPVDSATNRLAASGFVYDPAGNLTTGFGASRTFDPFNMVTGETGTGINREMLYSADNERVATVDWQRSEERWTVRGPGNRVLRTLTRDLQTGTYAWQRDNVFRGTSLLAATVADGSGGEETFHFHLDHLGTTRLKTDAAGNHIASYKYWPYGERTASTPTDDDDTLRFTGHERDFGCAEVNCPSTGPQDDLDYMHARYYTPWMGRFLSVDPVAGEISSPRSWNRFQYASYSPIVRIDPNGRVDFEALTPERHERIRELEGTLADLDQRLENLATVKSALESYTSLGATTAVAKETAGEFLEIRTDLAGNVEDPAEKRQRQVVGAFSKSTTLAGLLSQAITGKAVSLPAGVLKLGLLVREQVLLHKRVATQDELDKLTPIGGQFGRGGASSSF